MRNVEERHMGLVRNKALDQLSAVVRRFIIDDDHFPKVALARKIAMYFVQNPPSQILLLVVAGDNHGEISLRPFIWHN
jgi:hypothetical protein